LAALEGTVTGIVHRAAGEYTGALVENMKLSMPTLLREHFLYDRPYLNGVVNPGALFEPDIYSQKVAKYTSEFMAPLYDINSSLVSFNKYYTIEGNDEARLKRVEIPLLGGFAKWQLKF